MSHPSNADPQFPAPRTIERVQLEVRAVEDGREVRHGAIRQIVHADDFDAFRDQPLAEVRAEESRSTRDPNPLHQSIGKDRLEERVTQLVHYRPLPSTTTGIGVSGAESWSGADAEAALIVLPCRRSTTADPARRPAWPSHRGGTRLGCVSRRSAGISARRSGFTPNTTFVPCVTVTGRSVRSRRVKHGIPRAVVSSWIPPESVTTAAAPVCSDRNRVYERGWVSVMRRVAAPRPEDVHRFADERGTGPESRARLPPGRRVSLRRGADRQPTRACAA